MSDERRLTYNGLTFTPYITSERLVERVAELARQISTDCAGENPLFICVLKGAFMFATDLFRNISIDGQITFLRLSSYRGVSTTGEVKEIMGLDADISGRTVIIVEDIIDTGRTMAKMVKDIEAMGPEKVKIATLLFKPEALQKELHPDYVGFEIPNRFVIGYGLDIDEQARHLPDLWSMVDD